MAKRVARVVFDSDYWDDLIPSADGTASSIVVLPRESVVAQPFTASEADDFASMNFGDLDF